jgi:virulence factor
MSAVRVAVIGAGRMANLVHYPSLASIPEAEIVGICDVDRARLDETGDRWGVPARYTDWTEMVDAQRPDAVYVIGPPELMYEIWCACLRRGLDLFVEKPLGLTRHQAETLARLAREHDCVTQVGFQRRNSPLLAEMVDAVRAHGPVVHAVCRFYKNDITPMETARDHMMDDGVHAIDTLRHLCGEVVRVASVTRRVLVGDVNFIAALLEFDSGATGVLLNSWTSGRRTFGVEVHGPGVAAEGDLEREAVIATSDGVRTIGAADAAGSADFHVLGGFRAKSAEFLDAVRTRRQPSSNFADAAKTMAVAELILAQAALRDAGPEAGAATREAIG